MTTAEAVSATLLRLEGPRPSVAFRVAELSGLLRPFGRLIGLDAAVSTVLWREVRDVAFFTHHAERDVWRLSVPPAAGAAVVQYILASMVGEAFYDWAGGLIWLALSPSASAGNQVVRAAVAASGGHATLIRAEAAVRAGLSVFQPQPPPLAALTRRIKDGFDPHRVLNPGRMYADL